MWGHGPYAHRAKPLATRQRTLEPTLWVDGQHSHDAMHDEASQHRRHVTTSQASTATGSRDQDLDAALYERHVTNEPVMQAALRRTHWYSKKATPGHATSSVKNSTTSGPRPTFEAQGVSARDAQCTPQTAGSTQRPPALGNEVDAEALHPTLEATAPRCSSSGAHSPHDARAGGARKGSTRRHHAVDEYSSTNTSERNDTPRRPPRGGAEAVPAPDVLSPAAGSTNDRRIRAQAAAAMHAPPPYRLTRSPEPRALGALTHSFPPQTIHSAGISTFFLIPSTLSHSHQGRRGMGSMEGPTEPISEGPAGPDRFGAASAQAEALIGDIQSSTIGRRLDNHETDELRRWTSCDRAERPRATAASEPGSCGLRLAYERFTLQGDISIVYFRVRIM
ncbi:hypothetical protein GGX14DRAFT_671428 [Mycena pura]|uniref:Uncharacterized protein n=1 Tax=Mycena pura TaxID=153505 RepID=A0AAD6UZG0_9AGAR|nr:hypothetical protein GGX14DRAFT_671428 [Mycena pura]